MADNPTTTPTFDVGDIVRTVRPYGRLKGRIVELRGPLGPNRAQIYRIKYGPKGARAYTELREDQLEIVPARRDN